MVKSKACGAVDEHPSHVRISYLGCDLFNLVVGNFLSTALRAHRTLPAAA